MVVEQTITQLLHGILEQSFYAITSERESPAAGGIDQILPLLRACLVIARLAARWALDGATGGFGEFHQRMPNRRQADMLANGLSTLIDLLCGGLIQCGIENLQDDPPLRPEPEGAVARRAVRAG